MMEFIYKNLRHAEYRLQARECKKKSHAIFNNDTNNKEKTASSKLVGVKWCDNKQLLDEVFVIFRIIKVEVGLSPSTFGFG